MDRHTAGHRDKPCFFQRAENVADYNQIAAGTFMLSAASLMLKKVCSEWKDCELFLWLRTVHLNTAIQFLIGTLKAVFFIAPRLSFSSNHTPQSMGRKLTTLRARTVRIRKVEGSIPFGSTKAAKQLFGGFFLTCLSSILRKALSLYISFWVYFSVKRHFFKHFSRFSKTLIFPRLLLSFEI